MPTSVTILLLTGVAVAAGTVVVAACGTNGPGSAGTVAPTATIDAGVAGTSSACAYLAQPPAEDWSWVVVEEPASGAAVASGFAVSGCYRLRDASARWRLRDGRGDVIAEGEAVGRCADCSGSLDFSVPFPEPVRPLEIGTLEVVAIASSDGGESGRSAASLLLSGRDDLASAFGAGDVSACQDPGFATAAAPLAFIMVDEPAAGVEVAAPIRVRGCANVFEATVEYRLRHPDGTVLAEGFTTASCGTGCVGALDFAVDVEPTGIAAPANLELFSRSMRDGTEERLVAVPVIVP